MNIQAALLSVIIVLLGVMIYLYAGATKAPVEAITPASKFVTTVCTIDRSKKGQNPTYFHLPSVNTRLQCEAMDNKAYIVTLSNLYKTGWRLIAVADPATTFQEKGKDGKTAKTSRAAPLLYFEKELKVTSKLKGNAKDKK